MDKLLAISEIDSSLVARKTYLEDLFGVVFEDIFVCILTKEDFRKLKQAEWVVGFTQPKSKIIFMLSQEESGRDREEWLKVIVHEMVHLFYYKRFKTAVPKWFFEGLACHIAGQKKKERDISLKELIDLFTEDNSHPDVYSVGYNALEKSLK